MNTSISGLNDVQLTLLKLFSRKMTETEQADINQLLLSYYDSALQNEVMSVIAQKGYVNTDFEKILNKSKRTKNESSH